MAGIIDVFRKKLATALGGYGAKSEFSRKTGISRTVLDRWLSGDNSPTLETLERAAQGLGLQSWELIKPDAALPTPQPENPDTEALASVIAKQAARIKALEIKMGNVPEDVLDLMRFMPPNGMEQLRAQLYLYKEHKETGKFPEAPKKKKA
jgi:transcriptional regulator with XRE-family HTH domain